MEQGGDFLMTEAELKKNMKDRYWRLNHLYYIINEKGQRVLFECNKVQYLLYSALWWLNIILKSRQHGITTLVCLMMLDLVLFNSNVRAGIIAHTMQAAKEIFRDKIKYPYSNLPESLKAARSPLKDDACQLILNNNSSIIVATSLRSGTYQWVHVSEYGKICAKTPERAIEVQSGTLETVHVKSFITIESTAEGRAGDFYDRCTKAEKLKLEGKEPGPMDYNFHFFPWYLDPKNTTDPQYVEVPKELNEYFDKLKKGLSITLDAGQRAWYTKKKESLRLLIYREHPSTPEEAFRASIEGAYYGTEMAIAREAGRICPVPHEKFALVYTFWDIGHKHTAIWFAQFVQQQIRAIDYYQDDKGMGLAWYAQMLKDKPYRYGQHFGPWDISKKHHGPNSRSVQTGRDLEDVAEEAGIKFDITDKLPFEVEVKLVQDTLNKCWFDIKNCDETGVKCLEMFRAEWNDTLESYERKPLNDKYAHGARAFGTFINAYRYNRIGGVILGDTRTIPENILNKRDQGITDLLNVG